MDYIYEMPNEFLQDCPEKGKVERFEYVTNTYDEDNKTLNKGAWVYLPYGYDASKKYNILYLMHGGGVTEDWWFKMFPDTVTILDNMIAKKVCDPCIIVTPCLYHSSDDVHTRDESRTENFQHELRKDLIPGIESKYSTFAAGDVSDDNLVNTRDHRAFAGLSLGSMTTYRAAFYNNFDLFAWYGPFSGCCGPFGNHDLEVERIINTLTDWHKKGIDLRYMFCCNGDEDIAYAEHKDVMEKVLAKSDVLVPGKNYDFYLIPGGVHDMKAWQLDLYHALQIFFV